MISIKSVIGAGVGAALGALIWAVVSKFTGFEVGWIAWGVGALAGFGAVRMGGRGKAVAVVAAALALGGIFVGKIYAVEMAVLDYLNQEADAALTRESYEAMLDDARSLEATPPEDYPAFMFARGYTDESSADEISDDELEWFEQEMAPDLREIAAQPPSFEAWHAARKNRWIDTVKDDISFVAIVLDDLGPFDALWAILGLLTAYRVVLQNEEDEWVEQPGDATDDSGDRP